MEGFAQIEQESAREQFLVSDVGRLGNNPDELKSHQTFLVNPKVLPVDEIRQRGEIWASRRFSNAFEVTARRDIEKNSFQETYAAYSASEP